ncbi:MFS transporter [Treponema sp. TIM-1]|uniref:MFS transporter n=1 Tax=Treponema sp. TIM-1 TaxID=2898417 RepID=UPI0039806646
MKRDPKTMNPILLLVVVMAVGLQDVASGAISPAIASIAAAFPGVSTTMIQMLVTLPNILIVIMAPLYGWLSTRIQPRKIIIFGLVMFSAGGILPAFMNSLPHILFFRVFLGLGTGITLPSAIAIIPAFYEGNQREKLVGWNMSVGCFGCIIMQILGGYLTEIDWHYSFFAYGVGVFSLVMVLLFLPEVSMKQSGETEEPAKKGGIFAQIPKAVYGIALIYLVGMILDTVMATNISLQIETEGIGSPANSGIGLSLFIGGSLVSSLLYGKYYEICKEFSRGLAWVIMGIGFFMCASSYTIVTIYFSLLICGIGNGLVVPAYFAHVSKITARGYVAFSVAMISAAQGLGNFIVPVFVNMIVRAFSRDYGRFPILFSSFALMSLGIVLTLWVVFQKNRSVKTSG